MTNATTTEKKRAARKPNPDLDVSKRVGLALMQVKLLSASVARDEQRLAISKDALEDAKAELSQARQDLEALAKTATT